MNLLHPVQGRGRVTKLSDAVVEHALALAHSTEIEAKRRTTTLDVSLVQQLYDLVVPRPARLRVRMEDKCDWRSGTRARMETAFEAALRAWKDHFGH